MTAGRKCKAYVSSSVQTPSWVLMNRVSDVKITQGRSTSDRMFRGASSKKKVAGYKEYSFSFKYHPAPDGSQAATNDTVIGILENSFNNDVVIAARFMNSLGNAAGGKGIGGPVLVTKFDRDEADESGVSYDVEMVEAEAEAIGGALLEIAPVTV